MVRETATRELVARLDRVGFRSGRAGLTEVWPAVADWWRTPLADAAPEDDRLVCLLSQAPARAEAGAGAFAGSPPPEIAGRDLMCLEFGREFGGDAGVTLWYEAGPAWEPLTRTSWWIAEGPSTPHLDAFGDGQDPARLIAWLEASGVLQVASSLPALAVVVVGDGSSP
jgi:hypothetical protein